MTQLLVVIVTAFVVIAAASLVGPRLGIASPLVLVAIGVAASFLPVFGAVHIDPAWILEGVLPPLLYSSAVSMPAMNFRREFGAIISPTDAVATLMIRKTSVSTRVVAMLDGESLLNDATALVLPRTAIVATAASFSFWGAVGSFAYSVAVAVVIGLVVGWLNLTVRKRVTDPAVNTLMSFAVPFVASVPAGLLGASGLVAAVVAGLVTGVRAPRDLSPQSRLSDSQNWRTVELVLEGAVFLTMGLQIKSIVTSVEQAHAGALSAVLVALGALALTILVRAAYVGPLLAVLRGISQRGAGLRQRLQSVQEEMATPEGKQQTADRLTARGRGASERDLNRFALRVTRALADLEYFRRQPLGLREGATVVWVGMRGAVTVAAAQTLPDSAQRPVLVLIAFTVAAVSLLVQGGTIGPLLRVLAPRNGSAALEEQLAAERTKIYDLLRQCAVAVPGPPHPEGDPTRISFEQAKQHQLEVIAAQRSALLDARDNGIFDAEVLTTALATLDAAQIDLEVRGRLTG